MTWRQIKLATLQKMFAVEGQTINEADESLRPYLDAMPQAANEGVQLMVAAGVQPLAWQALKKPRGSCTLDLTQLCPDLEPTGPFQVYWQGEEGRVTSTGALLTAGRWLTLPWQQPGQAQLVYTPMPALITAETPGDVRIPLPERAAVQLPLYMASQLYKEDDLAMATLYRNEFEAALAQLQPQPIGQQAGEFSSVTGWV